MGRIESCESTIESTMEKYEKELSSLSYQLSAKMGIGYWLLAGTGIGVSGQVPVQVEHLGASGCFSLIGFTAGAMGPLDHGPQHSTSRL